MEVKKFIDEWTELGFRKKHPEAILIVQLPQKKGKMERVSVMLKLSRPLLNESKNKITFETIALEKPSHWIVGHPTHLGHLMIEAALPNPLQLKPQ